MNEPAYILVSLLLASTISASGAMLAAFGEERLDEWQPYLTPLAVGVIVGVAFVHLIPRFAAEFAFTRAAGLLAALGVVGSYALEEAVHRRYRRRDFEPFAGAIVAGDGIHNVVDGVVVASGYYVSPSVGVASTLAVVAHKLPKELGDFGALLQAGIDEWRAVGLNVLTNLFGYVAAAGVVLFSDVDGVVEVLLPLAIGNFVYVAGADLLPEVRSSDADATTQLAVILLGIGVMYAVTLLP